ncbi:RagB/SusD family nutrient uptake outer membrane protein [Pontibacter sp. G13]|uniref:RagB/SusD family nutrient uptake outer membrane protein n=1 Tax=Pontibacter sp. G13 TaxID=3074898 RepID=UPI00288A6DC4|nr:RagB/SusD family nutrient uptake outer membrane protein [Pontibacter sp. G13]WNJ20451.1 RagB/SusD family nutrient uptake outer membrane protein [Pontibacter sp. G13]
MKYFWNICKGLVVGASLCGLAACAEDEFLNVTNPNELVAETFFTSTENFNLALNGAYSATKSLDLFGQAFYIQTLLALPHASDYWNAQCRNEVTSGDNWVLVAWRGWYRVVSRANDVLENAPKYLENESPTPAEIEEMDRIQGQAYFLRALAYFHMVRLWGEDSYADDPNRLAVPLHLKVPTTREEMMLPRATVGEVYDQIVADLEQAEQLLPEFWGDSDIARVNKWAAKGYLGKVHLYREDFEKATAYFEEVIFSGEFDLVTFEEYDQIFQGKLEFSRETIVELNYTIDLQQNIWENGLGSGIALTLAPPGRGWSNCTPHGVNIFRFGEDPRLKICTYAPEDSAATVSGAMEPAGRSEFNFTGHSFRKYVPQDYSVYSTNRNSGINYVLMRLSDIYLMHAEALNAQGQDAQAAEFTNKVRRRAYGLDPEVSSMEVDFVGFSGVQLRDSIREERFRELFAEGHRWYDIVRWGIVEEEVLKYNDLRVTQGEIVYQEKDYYYPVPLQEVDNNPNVSPSTGYE